VQLTIVIQATSLHRERTKESITNFQ